jgi:hypothetical protein
MNGAFVLLEVSIAMSNQYAVPVVSPVITSVQANVLTALDALDVAGRLALIWALGGVLVLHRRARSWIKIAGGAPYCSPGAPRRCAC